MSRSGKRWLRILGTTAVILGVVTFWVLRPIRDTDFSTGGLTPIRDDALAARFAPVILRHELYGAPSRLLYRMAKSPAGEIHIAYHPFYVNEENPHAGFGATMSRLVYTGGYGLKDRMFGPADIELIEVVLSAAGKPQLIAFEDARNYDPRSFSVQHYAVSVQNPLPPFCFEIRSWNHLVAQRPADLCKATAALRPEYFSEKEWLEFKMVKKSEAILRRNRAHRQFERAAAP